jgi:hypothetical protein
MKKVWIITLNTHSKDNGYCVPCFAFTSQKKALHQMKHILEMVEKDEWFIRSMDNANEQYVIKDRLFTNDNQIRHFTITSPQNPGWFMEYNMTGIDLNHPYLP